MIEKIKYDVTALGECLVDFISDLNPLDSQQSMVGNPGGAPANVMAGLSILGKKSAFIGKVGLDIFGRFLRNAISSVGVDVSSMIMSDEYLTTLAMVALDDSSDREFSFYRNQTADVMLQPSEIDYEKIRQSRIFHFGSVSMTCDPARTATLVSLQYAKKHNVLVSCDVNLRQPLWADLKEAKLNITNSLQFVDILKLSEEELRFLTDDSGVSDIEENMRYLQEKFKFTYFTVTRGSRGSVVLYKNYYYKGKAYDLHKVDTTGAGDAYFAATLSKLLEAENGFDTMSDTYVKMILDYSNAAGSLATSMYGAIPAMPTDQQIENCMRTVPRL